PVFETEREVVLTSASIVAAYTRDPWFDRYSDHTAIANGAEPGSSPAFEGADPIAHELCLGDDLFALPAAKEITFWFRRAVLNSSWPLVVEWSRLGGGEWQAPPPA